MQTRESKNFTTFFGGRVPPQSVQTSGQLLQILSQDQEFIVGYEPYLNQIGLDDVFAKDNANAKVLIEDFVKNRNVNVSNNLGMTLLHTLIWADRPDLASLVLASPKFNKINFKFCIPQGMAPMYASALDLAIGLWRSKESAINIKFIELLLQKGALPPKPDKKFLNGEFVSEIYPFMLPASPDDKDRELCRSSEEIKDLLVLLHKYGFSVKGMEDELVKRLFDTEGWANNRAQEFSEKFNVSIEDQKTRLAQFMATVYDAIKNVPVVDCMRELTLEQRDNGENTLRLPFDPTDRPCCIM